MKKFWTNMRFLLLAFILCVNLLFISTNLLPGKHPAQQQKKCIEMKQSGNREKWHYLDCDFWSSLDSSGRLISGYRYRYLSYAALLQRMRVLEYLYPDFVTLESAQDVFGLQVVGR